tara:strand:+ start:472 stop:783 length:312 start_codon:yes stop_codon:yes gene_type:complete
MNVLPKDYTRQENLIADCLSEFGMRYAQQYSFFPYTVDFYLPEINMVIEADGTYGHLKKRDLQRDTDLVTKHEVDYILHIIHVKKDDIKETLWQGLNRLTENP